MTKKIMYSFQLPEDVSRVELNERATHLGIKVARLFDFATHLITKCTPFFLKHLGDLSNQYSMETWVIIEKILIDRKAQRDVFEKYWGADPRWQLAMMSDENGPIIGERLYNALFAYYDQQERQRYDAFLLSQPYDTLDADGRKYVDIIRNRQKTPDADVDYSSEITRRANIVLKKHDENKVQEYMKAIKALERAKKHDEALAMWPWPK